MTGAASHFGDRLAGAVTARGPICLGLDPRLDSTPNVVLAGVDNSASPDERVRAAIVSLHRIVIEAVADLVAVVKVQLAFYEQLGIGGLHAYRDTVELAHEAGLLVIADAKRNDVPSTADAYASAFLGRPRAGRPAAFEADALTVNPYLGRDSVRPFLEAAIANGKGIFVLVRTSNAGAADLQDLVVSDRRPLHAHVADLASSLGEAHIGASGFAPVGAVVGCTNEAAASSIRELLPHSFVLVVGYGTQAGEAAAAARCFHPGRGGAVVNASRSLVYDLPDVGSTRAIGEAVRANVVAMRDALAAAVSVRRA